MQLIFHSLAIAKKVPSLELFNIFWKYIFRLLAAFGAILAIQLAAVASASAEDNAPHSSFTFSASLIEGQNTIYVSASDNKNYDTIEPGTLLLSVEAHIKFKRKSGKIETTGIFLGNCSNPLCGNYPLIAFSASPISDNWPEKWTKTGTKSYNFKEYIEFDATRIPVTHSQGIALTPLGDNIVGKCNELKSANRSGNFSFSFDAKVSMSANSITTAFGEFEGVVSYDGTNNIAEIDFNGGDKNKQEDIKFEVHCGGLKPDVSSGGNQTIEFDNGDMKVENIKLFLSTFSDAYTEPTPGTRCKKAKLSVNLEANQTGPVPFRLWKQMGDGEIAYEDITVGAVHTGGRFFARYERWIEVDETTYFQFKARDSVNDPFYKETPWEAIHLLCEGVDGGGLQTELAPIELDGVLELSDENQDQTFAECPRQLRAKPIVQANRHGQVNVRLQCGNGFFSLDQLELSDVSELNAGDAGRPLSENMTHGTNQFFTKLVEVDETGTLACAMAARHSGSGQEEILALETIEVSCANTNPDLPSPKVGGLTGKKRPSVEGETDQGQLLGENGVFGAGPNLVPDFNTAKGEVLIRNEGNSEAVPSVAIMVCSGQCPEPSESAIQEYLDPAFDNALHFQIPALPKNKKYRHTLSFWDDLVFPPGSATFTLCADQTNAVVEIDEMDNCAEFTVVTPELAAGNNTLTANGSTLPPTPTKRPVHSQGNMDGSAILPELCLGGKILYGACTCPTGSTLKKIGPKKFMCQSDQIANPIAPKEPVVKPPEQPKAEIFVCKGGTIRSNKCLCPAGAKTVKVSRFEYVCQKKKIVEQASNKLVCVGGAIKGGQCKCGENKISKKIGTNKFQCVAVAQPPKKKEPVRVTPPKPKQKKLTCIGGSVRNGKCACGKNTKIRKLSASKYQCIKVAPAPKKKKPIRVTPPKKKKPARTTSPKPKRTSPVICKGGKIRSGKCVCPKGKLRKKQSKTRFLCFRPAG